MRRRRQPRRPSPERRPRTGTDVRDRWPCERRSCRPVLCLLQRALDHGADREEWRCGSMVGTPSWCLAKCSASGRTPPHCPPRTSSTARRALRASGIGRLDWRPPLNRSSRRRPQVLPVRPVPRSSLRCRQAQPAQAGRVRRVALRPLRNSRSREHCLFGSRFRTQAPSGAGGRPGTGSRACSREFSFGLHCRGCGQSMNQVEHRVVHALQHARVKPVGGVVGCVHRVGDGRR